METDPSHDQPNDDDDAADTPPALPAEDDDSALGDTDQHSERRRLGPSFALAVAGPRRDGERVRRWREEGREDSRGGMSCPGRRRIAKAGGLASRRAGHPKKEQIRY